MGTGESFKIRVIRNKLSTPSETWLCFEAYSGLQQHRGCHMKI